MDEQREDIRIENKQRGTAAGVVPLLLTIPQAAAVLAVGRTTVYELIGAGDLEAVHIGRSARARGGPRGLRRTPTAGPGYRAAVEGGSMASVNRRSTTRGVRYDVRYRTPTGDVRNKTFATRKEADRFANTVEADKYRGDFVDPRLARITLEEYATKWLTTRPNLRPRTRETYEGHLRLHINSPTGDGIELGQVELGKLTPSLVREWRSQLAANLSPNSVAKCYRLLRTILETAVVDELIIRNPCVIKGAGAERAAERPVATVEQVWALADATPPRYRCLILLAGFLGLRRGELLGLECRHVDLLHRTVRVEQQQVELNDGTLVVGAPKTEAGVRTVALPAFLIPELENHLAHFAAPGRNGHFFTGERSEVLRKRAVDRNWKHARAAVADLPDELPLSRSPTHRQHDHGVDRRLDGGTDAPHGPRFERRGAALPARHPRTRHRGRATPRRVRRATDTGRSRRFRAMDARWVSQIAHRIGAGAAQHRP